MLRQIQIRWIHHPKDNILVRVRWSTASVLIKVSIISYSSSSKLQFVNCSREDFETLIFVLLNFFFLPREHDSLAMSDASGTQTPSLSTSTSIPPPLESPFDFKEYEKLFANKKLQESLGELAFPDDDIEVKIEPRVNRTTKSSVPVGAELIIYF